MSQARHRLLYHALQVAAHDARKAADQALAGSGLSTAQTAVLAVVDAQQPVTQRQVARRLRLNESAVTAMVRRLEAADLVRRRVDPSDARVWLLELTAAGRRALARADVAFAAVNARLDAALGVDGVDELAELLGRVRAAFD